MVTLISICEYGQSVKYTYVNEFQHFLHLSSMDAFMTGNPRSSQSL